MKISKETQYSFYLFLTAFIWGVAFVAQRVGMDYVGAFTFNGVRFMLGAVCLIPVTLLFERGDKTDQSAKRKRVTLYAGLSSGLVLFVAASLQQLGIQITMSASKAAFITSLYIVLTPMLAMLIGKRTNLFVWLGTVLACIGLCLLSAPEGLGSVGWGDLALIVCALFWAVHILWVDHYAGRIYAVRFSIVQFMVCSVLSLICAFAFEPVSLQALYDGRVPILYSSILSVGVAYTLQIVGQRHVGPAKAALIFSTEALFAALGAAILISEILDSRSYIGCAFIFAGILASQMKGRKQGG